MCLCIQIPHNRTATRPARLGAVACRRCGASVRCGRLRGLAAPLDLDVVFVRIVDVLVGDRRDLAWTVVA